jgi:hypothetical protein
MAMHCPDLNTNLTAAPPVAAPPVAAPPVAVLPAAVRLELLHL